MGVYPQRKARFYTYICRNMTRFRQSTRSQLLAYQYAYGNKTASGVCLQTITDYSPFGVALDGRTIQGDAYRYGFDGMEKDDEVKGLGNSYDFGARMYDSRVGRWLSRDPIEVKYPNLSPYQFVSNCPIIYVDPDGKIIDLSKLTSEQITKVEAQIELMKASPLFTKMYESLVNSEEIFYLNSPNDIVLGGGKYDPNDKSINFSLEGLNPELVMSQEMFHAYQLSPEMKKIVSRGKEDGQYLITDIETEGEVATFYMAQEVYGVEDNPYYPLLGSTYERVNGQFKHGTVFMNENTPSSTELSSKEFNKNYQEYKTRFTKDAKFQSKPKNYQGPFNNARCEALLKIVKEIEADTNNLQGPRLEDGSYY